MWYNKRTPHTTQKMTALAPQMEPEWLTWRLRELTTEQVGSHVRL
eukprot:COSAG04_NODE_22573_length_352_cov_1.011858_1_plen_44_part_10